MHHSKPVLFSGIQPSGNFTLGNYIGAIKNWLELQNQYSCLFSLVDLHTITVRQDPHVLREHCYDALALYLAVGLDPKKSIIFLQSHVPAHSQLAWILNCYAYVGELGRMTQYKDKSKKHEANINVGLFAYPVLMAADILLYRAKLVPVGHDQKQHVEIARDLAARFNNIYGEVFVVPEVYHPPLGARIMSLQEPTKKMSKSDSDANAVIFLLDTPETITNKLKRAVTDSGREIIFDVEHKPGVANLLTILAAITNKSVAQTAVEFEGQGYGVLKSRVAEGIIEVLQPFQARYQQLRGDQSYLNAVLQDGAERANELAEPMLNKVHEVVGFLPYK